MKHVVAYPIARGTLVNLVAFVTVDECGATFRYKGDSDSRKWVHDETTEHVVAQFTGWESELMVLLQVSGRYFISGQHAPMIELCP